MSKYIVVNFRSNMRWKVLFRDPGKWLLSVYVPENERREDIRVLEKHDAPELFYLVRGKVTLVVSSGEEIEEVEMEPGRAYIVEGWHNAYRPEGGEGVAMVIEKDGVTTELRDISSFRWRK